jgi:6-phosphogluconate dehydrogenase
MKTSDKYEIGIIGLGTMGRNLLMNIADHGYSAIGLDKDNTKVTLTQNSPKSAANISATQDVKVFLSHLRKPRALLLLVPAGAAVDSVLGEISPLLKPGDLVIDSGNSHFKDTDLREKYFAEKGFYFFGMGVSGGEAGARNGPSIMPGGNKTAYERVRPILEAIAAKVKGEPCVTYLGPGSAGHYVKMVHNGIEYGLMELIAETYYLMKMALNLSDEECSDIYLEWNKSELNSYLLEITTRIFLEKDDKSGQRLIDNILDIAKQKGTGKWTCQDAMELQVPVPTIDAAVAVRDLSTFKDDRIKANIALIGPDTNHSTERKSFLNQLRNAYYASSIITFAQGMALLQKASTVYNYDLNLESVARIWRGGCIIRAELLESIMFAYRKTPKLSNLLLDPHLGNEVGKRQADLRTIVQITVGLGFPISSMMASLAYYDGYRSAWLPTNLTQAQRDYFGAHSYERIDEKGTFHTNWESQ